MARISSSATKVSLGTLILAFVILAPSVRAQDTVAGGSVYRKMCVTCHGPNGSGTQAGKALGTHDLRSPAVQKMSDGELTDLIAKGKNKMPAYAATFKGAEIKDLVAYIRTLASKTK